MPGTLIPSSQSGEQTAHPQQNGSTYLTEPTLPGAEIVRERYKNGAIKTERQVILDAKKNYINHGPWRFYLPNGRVSGQAFFDQGKKTGTWSRWFTVAEAPVFRRAPFNQFQAPFLTTFQYEENVLHGVWKISDAAGRLMIEIPLNQGRRDSQCTWLLPNGKKFQEVDYKNGLMHGPFRRWNFQGKLVADRQFAEGREIGQATEFHRPGFKKLEYGVLAGKVEANTLDDPWNLKFSSEKKTETDVRHGPVTAWYPNGQIQFTGAYRSGNQDGKFTWYYQNGQKQAEGFFAANKRHGNWIWWHENGMRASLGGYVKGDPAGDWQWWLADGKRSHTKSFKSADTDDDGNAESDRMKNASFRNKKPN